MKFIDFPRDYQRLFRFDGFSHLFNDMWMTSYVVREAMILTLGENTTFYLPKKVLEANLDEGVEFFADNERFQKYRRDYEEFIPKIGKFYEEHIKDTETLSLDTVNEFLKLSKQVFDFFYKTEFFYFDRAFKLFDVNPTIKENASTLYEIKEIARVENLNKPFFGKDCYYNVLARKVAKQFGANADEVVDYYSLADLRGLFEGKKADPKVIADRKIARIIKTESGKISYLFGEEAKKEILEFREKTGDVVPYGTKTLKGVAANKGIARGKVKVIISNSKTIDFIHQEFDQMERGDILVAETTSPEYMPACAKAGAILADQGGLLSHAAVVSREFGIPSIVALKYATKILTDGDIVEVDGTKGLVTILEKKTA